MASSHGPFSFLLTSVTTSCGSPSSYKPQSSPRLGDRVLLSVSSYRSEARAVRASLGGAGCPGTPGGCRPRCLVRLQQALPCQFILDFRALCVEMRGKTWSKKLPSEEHNQNTGLAPPSRWRFTGGDLSDELVSSTL